MKSQVSYIKKTSKTFHEYKLIEIISEREVKEHLSFIFPYYNGTVQHMFFSSDLQYMHEKLVNARQFMYKRVNAGDHENPTRVKWEMVVRFNQYPTDLNNHSQANYILSPDFTQYLDVDRKNKKYMIRDTFT